MLVLAVEGDQQGAQLAQVGQGQRAAVQIRARAPVGPDPSGERDRPGSIAVALLGRSAREALGERRRRGSGSELEDPLDVGLGGAWAHDRRPGAPAEQEVEGMGEHGLAGAGLPREHVQARA